MAQAQPPQLTGGHANNPGQQGGDDCSESKIDLLVLWRANVPPHVLVLFFLLPCMVLSTHRQRLNSIWKTEHIVVYRDE